jgi:2,4-dienoyl-CoA reductase-like NADH-dependent reductase (Old Yellow Enzyme family)
LPEIDELVAAFAQAARRALSVGFEIVEIHGAHGYLTHSFFSPHSNKRSDDFGGSLEKRMRFPLLVAEAVRAVWPAEKPVFYRASVTDNIEGGLPIEDSVALVLSSARFCSPTCLAAAASRCSASWAPARSVQAIRWISRGRAPRDDIPTMAVGPSSSRAQAEAILVMATRISSPLAVR